MEGFKVRERKRENDVIIITKLKSPPQHEREKKKHHTLTLNMISMLTSEVLCYVGMKRV